jgi:hypothetical protein
MEDIAKLSAADIPLSPIFIDFVSRSLDGSDFHDESWFDQLSEALVNPGRDMQARARERLSRLLLDEQAQALVRNVYRWFHDLAVANSAALDRLQESYRFICIVGLARTGGSYLTGELFSSLGFAPSQVPAVIAHDGFPDAQPLSFWQSPNEWIGALLAMGEYLTMLPLYFPRAPAQGRITVPKKLTKGVYAGGLFNRVFGIDAEYVITIRHPIASCVSTYEKSGGWPRDGRYRARSNIETWIKRDLILTGVSEAEVLTMDYFAAYIRYWEQYYIGLATSGLTANRQRAVVAFSKSSMESAARHWRGRFDSLQPVSAFVSDGGARERHPDWIVRSEEAMQRVAAVWRLMDLPFPHQALAECW